MTGTTLPGYSVYTKGAPEPPTAQQVVERQRAALLEIRRVMTDMNGCLDYMDVLGRIDEAVQRGLGEVRDGHVQIP